jgi:cytochrome d ubiquinol oxidase subunit I
MAFTLGCHIVLVPFGVALAAFMLVLNYRGIRRRDDETLLLAKRWSQVAAVLFAVGAISGTVLSFEMGLLWPGLMGRYGAAYGFPFAVEGIFFFLEAIFISIYIYGWNRLSPWAHFWSGVPVPIAGLGGTASVVAANSWMNRPAGITVRNGHVTHVNPVHVFFNGAFWYETLHMFLAAYIVAGFIMAAVYAVAMLRGRRDRYHRLGFAVPFLFAAVTMPVQIVVGDVAAREVFHHEPAKFATMEMVPRTTSHVPETLGGIYLNGRPRFGLDLPSGASVLSGFSPATKIRGLNSLPAPVRPSDQVVTTVHLSFDVMVAISFALLALSLWAGIAWWRHRELPRSPWFLRACVAAGPLSLLALWAGWVVTEVGRQPWTVVGLLLTRDAATNAGNVWPFFAGTVVIYAAVTVATVTVLRGMTRRWRYAAEASATDEPVDLPYGPHDARTKPRAGR